MIELSGEFRCLSTLQPGWVQHAGQNWPSPEHALAAARCRDADREQWWKEIWKMQTPEKARHLSKRIPLRKDWPQVRDKVLEDIMTQVLETYPARRQKLEDTGDELLLNLENTEFGCEQDEITGEIRGKNRLGNLLMRLRAEEAEKPVGCYTS